MNKSVTEIYDNIANWFDNARDKLLVEETILEKLLSELKDQPDILDLGCGTGEPIAKYLIEKGSKITGVDGAQQMIEKARNRFPDHVWLHQDMRRIDLDKKFDAILCWDSLFHLNCEDQRAMFNIFESHAKENCVLLFSCGSKLGEAWSPMYGFEGVDMYHASLDSDEYLRILKHYGYEILIQKENDPTCGHRAYFLAKRK